jgi:hypothetical protein
MSVLAYFVLDFLHMISLPLKFQYFRRDLSTYLPLALVQAAAFIQEKTIIVGEYLELLNGNGKDLVDLSSEEFETFGRDWGTPRAV